jgi:hypothetical protein
VVMIEIAGPFRLVPKIEQAGQLRRMIWAWFSVAYIPGKFGAISAAFRQDERQKCWDEINTHIKPGPLPGNGLDQTAERNGLVLASNLVRSGMEG